MACEQVTVNSLGEYLEALDSDGTKHPWFRGQRDHTWKLVPTAMRGLSPQAVNGSLQSQENAKHKRFQQDALRFLSERPSSYWEWVFLMQHHGAGTRLLDWSESALVAMHFALEEKPNDLPRDKAAAVWRLDPIGLNRNAGYTMRYDGELLAFGLDDGLDNYQTDRLGTSSVPPAAAGIGVRNSDRMTAQRGVFTITLDTTPIEGLRDGAFVKKIRVPATAKNKLRKEMRLLGFTEMMVYPDLDRLSKDLREVY